MSAGSPEPHASPKREGVKDTPAENRRLPDVAIRTAGAVGYNTRVTVPSLLLNLMEP